MAWLKGCSKYTAWEKLSDLTARLQDELVRNWHKADSTAQSERREACSGPKESGNSRRLSVGNGYIGS